MCWIRAPRCPALLDEPTAHICWWTIVNSGHRSDKSGCVGYRVLECWRDGVEVEIVVTSSWLGFVWWKGICLVQGYIIGLLECHIISTSWSSLTLTLAYDINHTQFNTVLEIYSWFCSSKHGLQDVQLRWIYSTFTPRLGVWKLASFESAGFC